METRALTDSEIAALRSQGCSAEDWSAVRVSEPFYPGRIQQVRFSGTNHLRAFTADTMLPGGISAPSGIYRSHLHDCRVGRDAYIAEVRLLARYDIGAQAVIENVNSLVVDGETGFGNGTRLNIVNEAGGRPLPVYDRLTAQIAFLLVFYRYRPELIERLEELINRYVAGRTAARGRIGSGARIRNVSEMVNVEVGEYAELTGAHSLERGTIRSCREDPARVGAGVIARDFIVLEGARISDGAMLQSCFVGQAVSMGKQFSAEHSAFFANSEAFHGEAVSLFAGPFTVTHHKSTLLIASLVSFFNAGSGTNQSNHMYKLGPVHQGILGRGSKTGSLSYLLWPSRMGPYTAVLGKHASNFDTSDLPFSYIAEEDGRSVLTPAMNLFTVGTLRDSKKWPARDKRKVTGKLDLMTYELFNPYTVGKVLKGMEILKNLYETADRDLEYVKYQGISIKRLMLKMGIKYYDMAVNIYLGNVLIARLEPLLQEKIPFQKMLERLAPVPGDSGGEWVDLAGLILPEDSVHALIDTIEAGQFEDPDQVAGAIRSAGEQYRQHEWAWCVELLQKRYDTPLSEFSREQLMEVVTTWRETTGRLHNMILNDALKEFDPAARIGYGINSSDAVKQADFEAVRGTPDDNTFIRDLKETGKQVDDRAETALEQLEHLK